MKASVGVLCQPKRSAGWWECGSMFIRESWIVNRGSIYDKRFTIYV